MRRKDNGTIVESSCQRERRRHWGVKQKKKPRKNEFSVDIKPILKIIAGVDICRIDGIGEASVLEIISEVGTDMSKWQSVKHFCAWLNLTPNTKITGGKIISSKMQRKKNHAGQTLRMCASSLSASKSPLGDYCRKMKFKVGKKGGVVATAHKMARIIYTMLKEQKEYNEEIFFKNQQELKVKKILSLEKQLNRLKQEV